MSLDDLVPDDAGDAKGGRPPEGNEPLDVEGDPFLPEKDTEEYWENVWRQFVSYTDPTSEDIADMCDYTHMFPWDLKIYIEKHDIHEFDWDHMPEDYPADSSLARALDRQGIENDFVETIKRRHGLSTLYSNFSDHSIVGEDNSTDNDSGLMGLVDDAKGD